MFGFAQKSNQDTIFTQAVVLNGDTMSMVYLPSIYVFEKRMYGSNRQEVKFTKLQMRGRAKVRPLFYWKLFRERRISGRLRLRLRHALDR